MRQIEDLQIVAQHMPQIVPRQESVEFGEFLQDQRTLVTAALPFST